MSKVGGGGGSDRSGGAGGSSGADRSRDTSGPDRSRDTSGPDKSKDVSSADKSKDVGKSDASDKAKEAGKAAAEKTKTDSFEKGGPPQAPDTTAKQKDVAPAPKVDVDLQAELKAEIAAKSTQTVIESPKAKEKPAEAAVTRDAARAAEVKAQNEALAAEAVMAQEATVAADAKAAAEAAAAEAVATQDAVVAAEAKVAAEALAAEAVMAQEATYQSEVAAEAARQIEAFEGMRAGFETAPVEATETFEKALSAIENVDVRADVLGSFEGELSEVVGKVEAGEFTTEEAARAMESIARSAEISGNAAAQSLAKATAEVISPTMQGGPARELSADLTDAITESVKQGAGVSFASHLTNEVAQIDGNFTARGIGHAAAEGVRAVREEFVASQADFVQAEKDWAALSKELPAESLREARAAFEARHSETFDAFETASQKLGSTLSGLGHAVEVLEQPPANPVNEIGFAGFPAGIDLGQEAKAVAELAPDLQNTKAGMDALAAQVAKRGMQEPNLLGTITDVFSKGKGTVEKAAMLISNATAHGALHAKAAGNTQLTESLLAGFQRSTDAFGLPPEKMNALTDALRQVGEAETPEAAREAARALKSQIGTGGLDLTIGGERIAGAIGAIGGALTLGDAIANGKLTNPDSLAGALKNYVDAAGASIDTTVGLANLIGKNTEFLTKANRFGTKVLGPIGGVLDGALAVNHLAKGEYQKAALSGLSAAGAIAMAVPGGQLIGAGLLAASVAGGFAVDAYNARQDRLRLEQEFDQTFQQMGFSPEASAVLSHMYDKQPDFSRIYQEFGGNPQALQTMLGMTPDQLHSTVFGGPRSRRSLH